MPDPSILSNAPITVPAPIGGTQDGVLTQLMINPIIKADGSITALVTLRCQHYRNDADGHPIKIGDPVVFTSRDVYADAASNANLAAGITAIQTALATFVLAQGL